MGKIMHFKARRFPLCVCWCFNEWGRSRRIHLLKHEHDVCCFLGAVVPIRVQGETLGPIGSVGEKQFASVCVCVCVCVWHGNLAPQV